MSWEWSHTPEATEIARDNLSKRSLKTLQVIYAEWQGWRGNSSSSSDLNDVIYQRELTFVRKQKIHKDVLVDSIWEEAEKLRTCDNGGFNAWVCPFGCHTVSFSTFSERMAKARAKRR